MSIQLTNIRITTGEHGPDPDGDVRNRVPHETRLDVPDPSLPEWSKGMVNEAYDVDSYDLPPYNGQTEAGADPGDIMGHKHVLKVDDLRPPQHPEDEIRKGRSSTSGSSSSSHSGSTIRSDVSSKAPDQEDGEEPGCWSRSVTRIQQAATEFFQEYGSSIRHAMYAIMILAYAGYFAWSLNYEFGTESSIRLLWMTMVAVGLVLITMIRENFGQEIYTHVLKPPVDFIQKHFKIFKWCFICAVVLGIGLFLGLDVARKEPRNLYSLIGMVTYVFLMFIFSKNPAKVRWRPVWWGLGLQFMFALLVLRTVWGYEAFKWLGDRVQEFMEYSDEGAIFLFGENFEDHFFAFKVLPIVIFFSSVISVLYYIGLMQTIIGKIAWFMQRTLGTTAAESTNAAGNIFIGQTEAPLLIRPMINDMTSSELHAVMVGGYATIAGSVMATYISIGVSANHLISASIMAAPCALAISKLCYPETQKSNTTADAVAKMEKPPQRNIIEAASSGATGAISLVANIAVNLMAFISLLAFVNTTLTWMGHRAGMWPPEYPELTFELICSYLLWPFAWVMGVESEDCRKVAELIGIKTFLNEFVAYTQLGVIIDNSEIYKDYNGTVVYTNDDMYLKDINVTLVGGVMQDRSIAITTYALCGFANIGSLGTVMGALGGMVPDRRSEIAQLAFRALIAGTVVSFLNACVAGLMYEPDIV